LNVPLAILTTCFILLLLPTRVPPGRAMYATCGAIQERIDADVKAGLKILVAHGMMYQLHAQLPAVPLDRANSYLELAMAGLADQTGTAARIRERYYDRIYLTVRDWYGPDILKELEQNYVPREVIPKPAGADRIELGRTLGLIGDCQILSRR